MSWDMHTLRLYEKTGASSWQAEIVQEDAYLCNVTYSSFGGDHDTMVPIVRWELTQSCKWVQ